MNDDGDAVFRALADSTRRSLLDRLFQKDGQSITELEAGFQLSRFGIAKHLRVLEEANLVVARKSGRDRRHYLNAIPIRLIHDRWIGKYTESRAAALVNLKTQLETER